MTAVELGRIEGFVGATTVTTVHYLASRAVGRAQARRLLQTVLALFKVAPVNGKVLADALLLNFPDYEDAVIHEAARHAGAAGIVTRDTKGFHRSRLRVYTPEDLAGILRMPPPGRAESPRIP